jgi:hypothetical protein
VKGNGRMTVNGEMGEENDCMKGNGRMTFMRERRVIVGREEGE